MINNVKEALKKLEFSQSTLTLISQKLKADETGEALGEIDFLQSYLKTALNQTPTQTEPDYRALFLDFVAKYGRPEDFRNFLLSFNPSEAEPILNGFKEALGAKGFSEMMEL